MSASDKQVCRYLCQIFGYKNTTDSISDVESCVSRIVDELELRLPAGLDAVGNNNVVTESLPLCSSIFNLKPSGKLYKMLVERLDECDCDDRMVALIMKDSYYGGKDGLFLVIGSFGYWDTGNDNNYEHVRDWLDASCGGANIITGSCRLARRDQLVEPDQCLYVQALQLSSWKECV